jgi:hypothetical protein
MIRFRMLENQQDSIWYLIHVKFSSLWYLIYIYIYIYINTLKNYIYNFLSKKYRTWKQSNIARRNRKGAFLLQQEGEKNHTIPNWICYLSNNTQLELTE